MLRSEFRRFLELFAVAAAFSLPTVAGDRSVSDFSIPCSEWSLREEGSTRVSSSLACQIADDGDPITFGNWLSTKASHPPGSASAYVFAGTVDSSPFPRPATAVSYIERVGFRLWVFGALRRPASR